MLANRLRKDDPAWRRRRAVRRMPAAGDQLSVKPRCRAAPSIRTAPSFVSWIRGPVRARVSLSLLVGGALAGTLASCFESPSTPVLATQLVSSRFDVAASLRAAHEMQLSGEPFARYLGYNLCGFDRTLTVTDQYSADCQSDYVTDPLGYALAVESYEYSRQPTNNLSFVSGAGLSLQFGPVLNPTGEAGSYSQAQTLLADRFQRLAAEANASGPAGANLVVAPPPPLNPLNYYGWPGLWPVFAEFRSFDPTIAPAPGLVSRCSFGGSVGLFAYGVTPAGTLLIANYECDYNSLHLIDRESQVDKTLAPDSLGYAAWEQALLVATYWKTMQDGSGKPITWVDPAALASVGTPGNQVVGSYPDPTDPMGIRQLQGSPGVYLGDTRMEGWQGLTLLDEIDNKAQLLLGSLLSADGARLGGTSILGADRYSYDSPLLYFPDAVAVTETPTTQYSLQTDEYFPQPTAFAVSSGVSRLGDLSGLLGGFGEAFALTDPQNPAAGGSLPFLATFDGDPFPADDGLPDGEATLHDRALGILKIALVDLDRLHFDPANKVLVDEATVGTGGVTRGTTVSTLELAESILALRTAARALGGSLAPGADFQPDVQGAPGALDATPLGGAGYGGSLQAHLEALIASQADFLSGKLVAADGSVANGWDLASQSADPSPTLLESEAGAIRALLDAYLATSVEGYRETAMTVYGDLQRRFWMSDVRSFRTTAGVDGSMQFTPLRFGLLVGALRQYYELVAGNPARHDEGTQLLAVLKRTYKLVLNGWDDVNQDDRIQYPAECRAGRLQMGERALTGELGHPADHGDRDSDCVREISTVGLPAALGAELDLTRP